MHDDLKRAVAADMPRLKKLLSDLVRLESVSAHGHDPAKVREGAEEIVSILRGLGYDDARLLESHDGHPAVFAEKPAPSGAPTLLLYAHYDVQPPGPIDEWDSGPFDPVERNGRLYGRGASDDKSGIVMHLGAIAAHQGQPPVGVQLFFEGEEEAGSVGLSEILERNRDLLHPDVIVIGDGGNWEVGTPGLLVSLRGVVAVILELRTLATAVHSGQYGGVVPDALTALGRLIATFHDDQGRLAIAGLESQTGDDPLDVPEEMIRRHTGAVDGLELIGSGSIPSRLWSQPALSVLAIDAPPVGEAINQLVPVTRAKVSLRIPPGQPAGTALQALKDHIREKVPWGAQVAFLHEEAGEAITLDTDNYAVDIWRQALLEAFGRDAVAMGAGGSIPFIATFEQMFPGSPILVVGCGDPTSAYHAPNESQDLGDLERATVAEAIAFRMLAATRSR